MMWEKPHRADCPEAILNADSLSLPAPFLPAQSLGVQKNHPGDECSQSCYQHLWLTIPLPCSLPSSRPALFQFPELHPLFCCPTSLYSQNMTSSSIPQKINRSDRKSLIFLCPSLECTHICFPCALQAGDLGLHPMLFNPTLTQALDLSFTFPPNQVLSPSPSL